MKVRLLLIIAIVSATTVLLTAFSGGYPSGAPAGYTGSPGDGHNCTSCHNGSSSATTGMISTNIPSSGYFPDSTYQITVSVTGSGAKGFEVSPQNAAGTQLGTLVAGSNNHLTGGTKYITQNAKINSTPATWIFSWTAPTSGTGDVTFYAAYCISKPVTKVESITVIENTAVPLSVTATANPSSVCLGGSSQLNCIPWGGSGTYTYSWSSSPSGFTSAIQNPVAQPTMTTVYTVVVNDGVNNASGQTSIIVQPAPTVYVGGDTTVCTKASLFWLGGYCTAFSSVLWTSSGDGIFNNPAQSGTYYNPGPGDKAAGSVNLTLTASPLIPCLNPVNAVKHVLFDPCTGIGKGTNMNTHLIVRPNPAHGSAKLLIPGLSDRKISYSVYSIDGKIMISGQTDLLSGEFIGKLDISALPSGIYYLRVVAGNDVFSSKMIVE